MSAYAVVGSNGFLGRALQRQPEAKGTLFLTRQDWDILGDATLPQLPADVEVLINCADYYPGLEATNAHPYEVWLANVTLYQRLFQLAEEQDVGRVITIGTTACYPVTDELLKEEWIEEGVDYARLNQKMLPYAASRFSLLDVSAIAARKGIEHLHLILPNFYGPGDKYEPGRSHLLSSWIRDFYAAKDRQEQMELWGDPQTQREFIFIDDAAALVYAFARFCEPQAEIYNVGHKLAPSYLELADGVCRLIGFTDGFVFDESKPNPRKREVMDNARMLASGVEVPPMTPFAEGLALTVLDYEQRYRS